ncbi:MAG: type II toxin-antitoxin system RelB/DinJ family antitoxin [Candidatus Aureabacteria bacterium]|nr:type II toxin-antitoxin system RelB/DinJ family antitoxin [Candidatus Auribacterota bacterium]MCK5655833.1 type II toxin-antitoxin system RelB/DinJ family antitoxin [Candidatus Auribacterota bacterium]
MRASIKSEMIRARITPDLKSNAEKIFKELGLSTTEAISLFYNQVRLRKGLPFDVVIPNKTIRKTFENTDKAKGVIKCKNSKDMFKKLGI